MRASKWVNLGTVVLFATRDTGRCGTLVLYDSQPVITLGQAYTPGKMPSPDIHV